ncbi:MULTISPECIES: DUF7261 family protein [Haloarcula]|uniref:Uncharacterized protein n=1 Tax=Haloarcula pellucida TaxID=1427151 RepID=A0A830GNM0_9EURY|nr:MULTISPECIES: hypothetical protein [Halomicroarcula]MBX0348069.1 hypothetical protein [Halomicroarcula pellucida]MDS0277914.1 hypothetical protein [Halomicroarcula sp. S1AR25-4]GGN96763.1 hypothetical protein GCM10009030_25420 [Halomicroarcula pellucida]
MADLNRDDRGQIILIAAFALAVTFVALALIVNSAIFTENLASRGETAGSDDALAMRAMVETNAGYALDDANRYNYSTDSVRDEAITFAVNNTSMQTEQQQAMTGTLVNVSYRPGDPGANVDGRRIAQNSSTGDDFTSTSGSANYVVAEDVTRSGIAGENATRAFVINASEIDGSNNATSFEIEVRDDSLAASGNTNTWQMHIWNPTGDVVRVVVVKNDGGSVTREACEVTKKHSFVRIDVTGGTVAAEPCDALGITSSGENMHFAAGAPDGPIEDYKIRFKNATAMHGNYSMVVRGSSLLNTNVDEGALGITPGDPYWTDAYYEITVEYSYDTPNLRYVTDIRVAPGEPDA